MPQLRGATRDPLSDLNARPVGIFARVSDLESETQLLCAFVEQKNGEDFVIDDPAHKFRHPTQSGIEVKCGVNHISNLQKQGFYLDLGLVFGCDGIHCNNDISRFARPLSPTLSAGFIEKQHRMRLARSGLSLDTCQHAEREYRHADGDGSPKHSYCSIHNLFAEALTESRRNSRRVHRFRDNGTRAIAELRPKLQQLQSILEFDLRNIRCEHRQPDTHHR